MHYIYIHMYVHTYTHTSIQIYVNTYIQTFRTYTHTMYTHKNIYTWINTYAHIHTYRQTDRRIHTWKHTCLKAYWRNWHNQFVLFLSTNTRTSPYALKWKRTGKSVINFGVLPVIVCLVSISITQLTEWWSNLIPLLRREVWARVTRKLRELLQN